MKVCAYCKTEGNLTREHVIPAFICSFLKEKGKSPEGWNDIVKKTIAGEATVKDVCSDCNNKALGTLDSYAKQLFIDSGLLVKNYTKENITLRYDYDLLLRWLLKVSYNSSRTSGTHAYLFEDYIEYILGHSPTPARTSVALIAYLAAPELYGKSIIKEDVFFKMAQGEKKLIPFLVRVNDGGGFRGGGRYKLRVCSFGPMVFYLLFFNKDLKVGHVASLKRKFVKYAPNAKELTPKRKTIKLESGDYSWLDLYKTQYLRVRSFDRKG